MSYWERCFKLNKCYTRGTQIAAGTRVRISEGCLGGNPEVKDYQVF